MQNLGTLDDQYTILSKKAEESIRIYYVAKHNKTNTEYIIEIKNDKYKFNNSHDNFPDKDINILKILNDINNPYILRYIGNGNGILALNNEPNINVSYIIYENAPKLILFRYTSKGRFSERHSKLIFKKILNGIQAMHNSNICHGDIKPNNIFLDENYNPKIYGFYASFFGTDNFHKKWCSKSYTAPEVYNVHYNPYSGIKSDIFSLGQLLFNLVSGMIGFHFARVDDKYYKYIKNHQFNEYWQLPDFNGLNLTQSFKNLFVRMVAFNPDERPTIDQILNDVWMQEINNLNAEQINVLENELKQEFHNRENLLENE